MNASLGRQIESFLDTAQKARTAEPRERRESIQRLLVRRADALREQRAELVTMLDTGWDYLNANPEDPEFVAHEDQWAAWLNDLEAIDDALSDALVVWLGDDEREAA